MLWAIGLLALALRLVLLPIGHQWDLTVDYNGTNLLTYVDWSSTISVDGHSQNLWDNFHGYSFDAAHRQVFATTSGTGWQLVVVITTVDQHTVTVHYDLVARSQDIASPHSVVLTVTHVHSAWFQPSVNRNTFTAQVLPNYTSGVVPLTSPKGIGELKLRVEGPAVPASAIAITDLHSAAGPGGSFQSIASALTTTYTITNPQVNRLTPLGTETLTFTSAAEPESPQPGAQPQQATPVR